MCLDLSTISDFASNAVGTSKSLAKIAPKMKPRSTLELLSGCGSHPYVRV